MFFFVIFILLAVSYKTDKMKLSCKMRNAIDTNADGVDQCLCPMPRFSSHCYIRCQRRWCRINCVKLKSICPNKRYCIWEWVRAFSTIHMWIAQFFYLPRIKYGYRIFIYLYYTFCVIHFTLATSHKNKTKKKSRKKPNLENKYRLFKKYTINKKTKRKMGNFLEKNHDKKPAKPFFKCNGME